MLNNLMKYLYWFVGLLLAIFILYKGPQLVPDSYSFINAGPTRSAGYPVIILFFRMIFGKFALNVLFFVQLVLVLYAIQYFLRFLKVQFKLNDLVIFLVSLLFYFYVYRIGGKITSEPFSLILLLFSLKYLLESIFENRPRSMHIFFGLLVLLVLIRGQFYFLYPIALFVIVFQFYQHRDWKVSAKYLALLILVVVGTNLVDRTYHYAKHGRFMGTPFTGLQLVTDALYVSTAQDSLLFADQLDREMFNAVYAAISEQGLIMESKKAENPSIGPSEIIYHYNYSYNPICHDNTKLILGSYFEDETTIEYWKNIDEVTLRMSKELIKKHPVEFVKLYIWDITRNGFFANIFLIFFVITLIYSLIVIFRFPDNKIFIFLVLSSFIVISNFLLVALVEPILDRYSFYGNIIYYASLFVAISSLMMTNDKTKELKNNELL